MLFYKIRVQKGVKVMRFSEFIYKRIDLEETKKKIQEITEKLKHAQSVEEQVQAVYEMNDVKKEIATADSLVYIRYTINTKDEFYANGEKTVKKIQQMVPDCEVSIHPLEETDALYAAIKDSDILGNATKVGMKPLDDQSLVEDVSVFHPDLVVADAVYNPKETKFVQSAKAAGCKVAVGGTGMLMWQGAAAFNLFTGKDMPTNEVYELFFK